MNPVYAIQAQIADALTAAGIETEPVTPRTAATPYRYVIVRGLGPGQGMGGYAARFEVICVGDPADTDVMVEQVTDMAVEVVNAIEEKVVPDASVIDPIIGNPGSFQAAVGSTLAVAVSLSVRVTRAQMRGA